MSKQIILGLTGTMGSGKGTIHKCFEASGINYFLSSLSDIVREEARLRNVSSDREVLKKIGNELRSKYGEGILAQKAKQLLEGKDYDLVIIDGIRMPGEVEELRKNSNFYLIGLDAQLETRFLRIKNRAREIEPNTQAEFEKLDYEDRGFIKDSNGQQTEKCLELSDFLIWNDEQFKDIKDSHLYKMVIDAYELFSGRKNRRPTVEEQFMMSAHLSTARSTCLRRRVGAVATRDNIVISTGYNGSSKGVPHCTKDSCLRINRKIPSGQQLDICRAVHAEGNIVAQAAYHGISLRGARLYITNLPCYTCSKLLTNAGIQDIIYELFYPDELTIQHFKETKESGQRIRRFQGVTSKQYPKMFSYS